MKEERIERKQEEAAEKKKQMLEEELKRKELERQEKELLVDKAPILSAAATPVLEDKVETKKKLESKDMHDLEDAVLQVSKEKKLVVEKEDIQELKEEMAEYQEDLQELQMVTAGEAKPAVKESVAAKRLSKKVNKMIGKMDKALGDLQAKELQLKKGLEQTSVDEAITKEEEILKISDIMNAIRQIKGIEDEAKMQQIESILSKIDDDRDGQIKVEDVMKIIEIIGKENVKLTTKQIDEVIELLEKEEVLEVEGKIEKVLQKEKDIYEAEQQAKIIKKSTTDEQNLTLVATEEEKTKKVLTNNLSKPPPVNPQILENVDKEGKKTKEL